MYKRVHAMASIVCSAILLISLNSCKSTQEKETQTSEIPKQTTPAVSISPELNKLEIEIFKIGQADAILITTNNGTVLIDAGEDEDGTEILDYLNNKKQNKIDYFIVTHFDKDHVGGADFIIKGIVVQHVMQPDYQETGQQYEEYKEALQTKHIEPVALTKELSFALGDAQFTIYPPDIQANEERADNDYSLIVSMEHEENSFLFAGDAQDKRLSELIAQGNLKHTFLKVPYHGKYIQTNETFFAAVQPKYAVITCSDKNPEDQATVDALKAVGAKVFLTRNGDITCISDGKQLKIIQ